MDGIVLIDKPNGWTSFDVVAKLRGILKNQTGLKKVKVGHTGTLDPLATGLMILVVGSYCKRAQEFSKLDKTYEVEMKLGVNSSTGDEEGDKVVVSNKKVENIALTEAVNRYIGLISQIPPAYSAIKIDGKRAYQLAREGKEVVIQARNITIYDIREVAYDYPMVRFVCDVSSGTYIRSLVSDIGENLGVGAYMTNLRRTKVGDFMLSDAVTVESFSVDQVRQL